MMNPMKKLISLVLLCCCLLNFSNIHAAHKIKGTFYILNDPTDAGMFAVLNTVLGALYFYERDQSTGFQVDFNTGRYLDTNTGPNWWDYFFDPIFLGDDQNAFRHYFSLDETVSLYQKGAMASKFDNCKMIQKYFRLKPEIENEVNEFVATHFNGYYVIGIHHRGTDKVIEHPLVPYDKTINALTGVINYLQGIGIYQIKIYVASDDQNFLDTVKQKVSFPIIYNQFARSTSAISLHDYAGNFYSNNYQKGKEALLDCLLLSKCNFLIYPGTSSLSDFATYLNPELPGTNLRYSP